MIGLRLSSPAMSPRHSVAFLLLVSFLPGCLRIRPESLVPPGASSARDRGSEFLDGRPKSLVVLGDSTSLVWPALLQEMLDRHAEKAGVYRVLNASLQDARAAEWTAQDAAGPTRAMAEDFFGPRARLRERAPAPTIALCQVSLAGIGDERGPVKSEHDMLGAELGAGALEKLALELRELGIQRVVFATPLYEEGAEPENGLVRVALARLLDRGHPFVVVGPDLWDSSRRYFPDGYDGSRVRPNEFGMKLLAEEWYRWLAGPEAREDVVQALYAKDYEVERLERAYLAGRARDPRP